MDEKTKKESEKVAKKAPVKEKILTVEDFYTVGKWKRFAQYKCKECPFDSLDEKQIKEHVLKHMTRAIKPKVKPKFVDRFGNELDENKNRV